jgi:hypothetical protein
MDQIKLPCVDRGVVTEGSNFVTPSHETVLENCFGGELNVPPKRFIFAVNSADESNSHGSNAKLGLSVTDALNLFRRCVQAGGPTETSNADR